MYKKLLGLLFVLLLVGCDSGGSSSGGYTPQPKVTTRTVMCPTCGGAGGTQNPYNGQVFVCTRCNGSGHVTVTTSSGGSNPSFQGDNRVKVSVGVRKCNGFGGSLCSCKVYKGYKIAGTDTYVGACENYAGGHPCGHSPSAHEY